MINLGEFLSAKRIKRKKKIRNYVSTHNVSMKCFSNQLSKVLKVPKLANYSELKNKMDVMINCEKKYNKSKTVLSSFE